jgi:hypothetical protein
MIFDSAISPRIFRDYSEDFEGPAGPGVSGVALDISRWVGADLWGYGAVSEEEEDEEEDGSESFIV